MSGTQRRRSTIAATLGLSAALVVGVAACSGGGSDEGAVSTSAPTAVSESAGTVAPSSPAPAPTVAFAFGWPAGCRVPVVEETKEGAQTLVTAYEVVTVQQGENLVVSVENVVPQTIDGDPVAADLVDRLVSGFVLPDLVISSTGDVVAVEGHDRVIDEVLKLTGLDPNSETAEGLRSEGARRTLEATVVDEFWAVWAGIWTASGELPVGRSERRGVELTVTAPAADGTVEATFLTAQGGAEVVAAMIEVSPELKGHLTSAQRINRAATQIDPKTARPVRTEYLQETTVVIDGESRQQVEQRTTRFDWSAAGC